MSFWGALTGDDAKGYAKETKAANDATLGATRDANAGFYGQGYQTFQDQLNPYAQRGGQAANAYTNMLGLNGAPAQQGAQGAYRGWNPFLGNQISLADQTIQRRNATTGQLGSGMDALARQRSAQGLGSQDFYNYNQALSGQAQQGYGAANALAQGGMQNAGNLAGNQNNFAQGSINNQTQYGNAMSQANQSGFQNMLGLGSLGLMGIMPGAGGVSALGNLAGGAGGMFGGFGGGANSLPYNYLNQQAGSGNPRGYFGGGV